MEKIMNNKKTQKGAALPISLFVLLGLTIASASLFRTSEMSVNLAGNIGLRTMTGHANDNSVSQAINWLLTNQATLRNTNASQGYLSSYAANNDIDYNKDSAWAVSKSLAKDSLGNTSKYIIYRMCTQADTAYNGSNSGVYNNCATKTSTASSNYGNSTGFGSYNFQGQPTLYYKIISQTVGPKGAKTITSTIVGLTAS